MKSNVNKSVNKDGGRLRLQGCARGWRFAAPFPPLRCTLATPFHGPAFPLSLTLVSASASRVPRSHQYIPVSRPPFSLRPLVLPPCLHPPRSAVSSEHCSLLTAHWLTAHSAFTAQLSAAALRGALHALGACVLGLRLAPPRPSAAAPRTLAPSAPDTSQLFSRCVATLSPRWREQDARVQTQEMASQCAQEQHTKQTDKQKRKKRKNASWPYPGLAALARGAAGRGRPRVSETESDLRRPGLPWT
eukprot:3076889-Rhodomonas_salina.2